MQQDNWDPNDTNEYADSLNRRTEELYAIDDLLPNEHGIIEAPVMPLRGVVVYPNMVSPLFIGREKTLWAVEDAQVHNQTLIALAQRNPDHEDPGPEDFLPIGIEVAVGRLVNMPEGASTALVQGRRRVELIEFSQAEPYLKALVRPIFEEPLADRNTDAVMRSVLDMFKRCVQLNRSLPEEAYLFAMNIDDPGWMADMIATAVTLDMDVRHKLLAMLNPLERLGYIGELLAEELEVLELEDEIQSRTRGEVDRTQREFYLREQMKVIQTELGDGDPFMADVAELSERIEKTVLTEPAKERALKELKRLNHIPPISPEVGIIRGYIDWILDLPWQETTQDNLDVKNAAVVLDEHHFGLPKAKDRILEYIAVKSLKPKKSRQPILCFVGPPGTGKTSLGRSIAASLGREFVRISLGGVRDEAEIRGHRRTYIGALPGRILQTMKRAKVANPLFMLDEIDKLGISYRGDPSSALLEVLDPEQNNAFSDHYLELDFDLSNVMFITTANSESTIPDALLDRMEVIEFPGYIEEEKLEIARRFLIPRQSEESSIDEEEIEFTEAALRKIIRDYTYEAGVRNFEREIGRVCRKVARIKAEGDEYPRQIEVEQIERFLGPTQFFYHQSEREDEVGVATAVAWTFGGGEIMPVEVVLVEGKGGLKLTGQLGDVMQESAQAAFSFLQARAKELDLDPAEFQETDIHLHIPAGAIPKDGPSAGVTIATSLISAFTERKVRCDLGMTGEITLRGRVLPVGGVREKILAAHRAELKIVLIPEENKKDLVDIPQKARDDLDIRLVKHMDEILEIALRPAPPKVESEKENVTTGEENEGEEEQ
ncbi:MAG: endopeptidase La [Anaerolineales bacterium]|nr:endopeptidase La [Chloroflexota bacterium]MBL6981785.1 endopeptidase La [Anaerolineales bacterium]